MTVTLNDARGAVQLAGQRTVHQVALLTAQAHGTAQVTRFVTHFNITFFVTPLGDQRHDRVFTVRHELR
ncbi:Uncharacterised protein [Edwardsiella tarda]|nr:Uncharacterised protein [Edwardsiella tarda]